MGELVPFPLPTIAQLQRSQRLKARAAQREDVALRPVPPAGLVGTEIV